MSIPNFSLERKVALITGARRGIGRTFAIAFAEAGADVALCDYTDDGGELESVKLGVEEFGRRALIIRADIALKADVERMVQKTVNAFGRIDILVNNAGIAGPKPFLELDEDFWDKMIDTHVKGYYLCSQAVARIMVPKRQGVILNMGSISGLVAMPPGIIAYNVAKAGVHMLTKAMAKELGLYNIRVNAICPSLVMTQLSSRIKDNPELRELFLSRIPLGRFGETTDLVGAAIFLVSDASSWITGHCLVVDGGMMA